MKEYHMRRKEKMITAVKSNLVLLLIIAIFSICAKPVPLKKLPEKTPVTLKKKKFQRGLWVRAVSIASADSIPRILHIAENLGITDLYVQVVVAGYAYYKSNILPRSQYLSEISGSDYDPLHQLLKAAQNKRIRVHAWVNALLVWSLKEPPDSLRHTFYTHPEWFIKDVHTRSMIDYSYEEWTDAGLEGLYLDPANIEVQKHIKNVCREIVSKYPVNGIHLDFIRYPGTLWGLPENDTAAIFAGVEGHSARWLNLVRYPQLSFLSRWYVWHNWKSNKHKENTIFKIIQHVHEAIHDHALNSDCVLATAAFADPSFARYQFAQNWLSWKSSIDYPVVMSYTKDIGLFSDILNFVLLNRTDAVFGIGFIWPDMEAEAYWQVKKVRQKNGAGICFFDFTSIDTMVDFQTLKRTVVINEDSLLKDTTRYAKVNQVFIDLPDQKLINNGKNHVTQNEYLEFAEFLLSLSLNENEDLERMDLRREGFVKRIEDDVAAFNYLNSIAFLLTDELIEPETREVHYEFLPFGENDSATVVKKARNIKKLNVKTLVHPGPLNKLVRAAFNAEQGKKEICITRSGVYAFEVKKINEGGKKVARQIIKKELLPIYIYWTIREKLWKYRG